MDKIFFDFVDINYDMILGKVWFNVNNLKIDQNID